MIFFGHCNKFFSFKALRQHLKKNQNFVCITFKQKKIDFQCIKTDQNLLQRQKKLQVHEAITGSLKRVCIMAIWFVEYSIVGYKIRKIFA